MIFVPFFAIYDSNKIFGAVGFNKRVNLKDSTSGAGKCLRIFFARLRMN